MRTMTPKMLGMAFRKYITPMMKGENKMNKNKTDINGIMPMFQGGKFPMPPMPQMPVIPPVPPMPFAPFQNAWGQAGNQNSFAAGNDSMKVNDEVFLDAEHRYAEVFPGQQQGTVETVL